MAATLSARAVAARCGVSERTLRRWIVDGRLPAVKVDGAFQVAAADLEMLNGRAPRHAAPDAEGGAPHAAAPRHAAANGAANGAAPPADTPQRDETVLTLLAEVRRLNDERAELYGRLGYFQAQLEQAQTTIKALEAPKEPTPTPAAPRWPEESAPADPLPRPWWRFWG
jgi:excisionase family DNA binding protein